MGMLPGPLAFELACGFCIRQVSGNGVEHLTVNKDCSRGDYNAGIQCRCVVSKHIETLVFSSFLVQKTFIDVNRF